MQFNELDRCLLKTLARVKFATPAQLAYWCNAHRTSIQRRLARMESEDMVVAHTHQQPTIWALKHSAAALMQTRLPAGGRRASWSVMAHTCHKNAVEIQLGEEEGTRGFRFLDRAFFWKHGLNPAHGENGGVDQAKRAYLVLLDDYRMQPQRIGHTWVREHKPPRQFFSGHRNVAWSEIVHQYLVVTTDSVRAEQHQSWIERHTIPARVLTIRPLWD